MKTVFLAIQWHNLLAIQTVKSCKWRRICQKPWIQIDDHKSRQILSRPSWNFAASEGRIFLNRLLKMFLLWLLDSFFNHVRLGKKEKMPTNRGSCVALYFPDYSSFFLSPHIPYSCPKHKQTRIENESLKNSHPRSNLCFLKKPGIKSSFKKYTKKLSVLLCAIKLDKFFHNFLV